MTTTDKRIARIASKVRDVQSDVHGECESIAYDVAQNDAEWLISELKKTRQDYIALREYVAKQPCPASGSRGCFCSTCNGGNMLAAFDRMREGK